MAQPTDTGLRRALLALVAGLALLAMTPRASADECVPAISGLENFHAAVRDAGAGKRARPLTVLHLGDSHISLDGFTRGLRTAWQARFGDAGRGLMPGVPFRYYAPDGYTLAMSGPWDVFSSLPADASGPFGIQGFRIEASSREAVITLASETPLTGVEIEAHGGPETGAILLHLGEAAPLRLQTRQAEPGYIRFRVPAANVREVRLSPAGTGPVRLLGWAMLKSAKPGIRYDSHGIVAATAAVTTRWDAAIVRAQIAALKPDLVILGYGTNEGFNNGLDMAAYRALVEGLADQVIQAAPGASLALLGPFDGARQGSGEACADGWATPPNLEAVRTVLRDVAAERGFIFWDGGAAMGGRCAADRWARADPPLMFADRVHLRASGGELLAASLHEALMAGACHGTDAPG